MTFNDSFLGSLLGLPVECSKEKSAQQKHKPTIKLTQKQGFRTSKLAIWMNLHREQSLSMLNRCGMLEYNMYLFWIDYIL